MLLYQYHSKELRYRLLYLGLGFVLFFIVSFKNMEFLLYKTLCYLSDVLKLDNEKVNSVDATVNLSKFIFTELLEGF